MLIDMFQTIDLHAQLQKQVIQQWIPTATIPVHVMNTAVQQTRCHGNMPLYVIVFSDTGRQHALSQVIR
jgi:hypothetical protein